MKKVAIIMGSDSDFPIVSKAIKQLKDYDVPFEVHVMSAHRTPDEATSFAKNAKDAQKLITREMKCTEKNYSILRFLKKMRYANGEVTL